MIRLTLMFLCWAPSAYAGGDVAKGSKLYQGSCMACHGVNADGNGPAAAAMNPPPTNFRSAEYWEGRTNEQLKVAIKSGSPGTSMMPFTHLRPDQVTSLVAFLRTLAPSTGPEEAPIVPHKPAPPKTQ